MNDENGKDPMKDPGPDGLCVGCRNFELIGALAHIGRCKAAHPVITPWGFAAADPEIDYRIMDSRNVIGCLLFDSAAEVAR